MPIKPFDSTLPPEDPAIRRSTFAGPNSGAASAKSQEPLEDYLSRFASGDVFPIPRRTLAPSQADPCVDYGPGSYLWLRCRRNWREYLRLAAEREQNKCGHSAMICGGIELPMNDEPSPRGALAEEPYVWDGPPVGPLGCGDDHRSLLPPVTAAAPLVETITESHRRLKLAVHDFLVFQDSVIPFREWSPNSEGSKLAWLIGYTGGK